jgi:hypothetical protein
MIREPLLQFLLIGSGIYALFYLYGEPSQQDQQQTIVVTTDYVDSLASSFSKRWNRTPSDEEMRGLVNGYVRESLLYREALAMGLDKEDHIIRRRLAQKLEFLTNDLINLTAPDDALLEQYLKDNADQFRGQDYISFTQVFIDSDKRGERVFQDAATLLAELQAEGPPSRETLEKSDRLMLQSVFSEAPRREVQRQLGQEFTDAVMQLEPGLWHGPVRSGYGLHLVFVSEYTAAQDPLLADVKDQVLVEYQREQTKKFNDDYLDVLKERYTIIIGKPIEDADDVEVLEPTP